MVVNKKCFYIWILRVSLAPSVFQSPPDADLSSLPNSLTSSFFPQFISPPVSSFSFCHLLSFLSLQLSLASLRGCLSFPSPVTLEGFNHQLNVTPYLMNAWEHTHTHTHNLPTGWWSYTFSYFIFFFHKQLERHAWQDGALPHANGWALFAYVSLVCLYPW